MIRQAKPDALTLLIHCGWGDLPQSQARKTVPADVLADAEAGRYRARIRSAARLIGGSSWSWKNAARRDRSTKGKHDRYHSNHQPARHRLAAG